MTASIVGSLMTIAASCATATPGKRRCSCLSRSPSRATTVFTTLAGGLSKLRIRFGPQCPAPMTAVRIGSPRSNRPQILHCLSKIRADGGAGLAGAPVAEQRRAVLVERAVGRHVGIADGREGRGRRQLHRTEHPVVEVALDRPQ